MFKNLLLALAGLVSAYLAAYALAWLCWVFPVFALLVWYGAWWIDRRV